MKGPLRLFLALICLLAVESLFAQQRNSADSTQFRDSMRRARQAAMAQIFADTAKLVSSDYQLQIEKAFVILDNVSNKSELGFPVLLIRNRLKDSDSVLSVLKENILHNSSALNLRNLQVFRTLLQDLQTDLRDHRATLDSTENDLNDLRTSMKPLLGDTILRQVYRDSALRQQFSPQVRSMRQQFRAASEQLRGSLADINQLQTQTSSAIITSTQLLERVNELLNTSAVRIFGKEYNYMWERDTVSQPVNARAAFARAYGAERKAVQYYFKDSGFKRVFLLMIGFLFFIWMYRNIRLLKKHGGLEQLTGLPFTYLPEGYVVSALVIMFCIAPFFDLHAPSVYIESMQFLLLIILTIICWKKWPRPLFVVWIVMAVLYICFSFFHHVSDPSMWQRWLLIGLNVLSVVFGSRFLTRMKDHLHLRGFLRFVIILHNVMNILSVICNLTGRFTLAQLLGNAAIFSFMQAVGLAVFSKICMEAILLQIVASRAKRSLPVRFDYAAVLASFRRLILTLVVVLWVIVFTTNLNIYHTLLNGLTAFLTASRKIGDASFTMGGVLLFFMIIWIAHLLQRYIGYFFGAGDSDEEAQDKRQRSRLLIARLILLCLGYLLAVAASGVPVDKITIVLGALGVGIGLGLQNIVNNFVSGIILIFDRPLQIGDIVEVGGHSGKVREIGLRSSTIQTSDGAEVVIPNGDILSEKIVNWTLTNNHRRLELDLLIKGSDDMEVVSSAVKETVKESAYVIKEREPQVLFTKLQSDELGLKVFLWCADVAQSEAAMSDLLVRLKTGLSKKGLELGE